MSLVFEIEFVTGVCRAAREPGDTSPDWPPQPDRVFSALVSAWAARGERPDERAALEWLEKQSPPAIHASNYTSRTVPDVFVPPNDPKASKAARKYIEVMPDHRRRQPRRFPIARPDDPIAVLAWPKEPETIIFETLDAIARDVGYIGHSASLTRCRFLTGGDLTFGHAARLARRHIYSGRLRELERLHHANPVRPAIRPGNPLFAERSRVIQPSSDWLVLEVIDGKVPDVRAAALVCRLLRQALMSGYRKKGSRDAIPEIVSGHAADGTPTRLPHLAIAPMAFAGFPHADGRVFGFVLIPPRGVSLNGIEGLRGAFEQVAPYLQDKERRVLALEGSPLKETLRLAPAHPTGVRMWSSLSPAPYLKPSRFWASVTPIVLERHLKRKDDAEIRELIVRACENAGLPRPAMDEIQVGKHSAVNGMPPARPLSGEPPWMRWKAPVSLASRPLVHAVISFEREVAGPVLLGAGRFTGLGLCRRVGN